MTMPLRPVLREVVLPGLFKGSAKHVDTGTWKEMAMNANVKSGKHKSRVIFLKEICSYWSVPYKYCIYSES